MKTLTISIAAYNVEQYLRQTLESFVNNEVMDKIEVLIIDDGSVDGTKDIAMEYQNRFPDTFIYIYKENGGHGSTINKGIELATGKYFRICDGDDWLDTDSLIKIVKQLENIECDMVITNYNRVYPDGTIEKCKWGFLEENRLYKFSKQFDYRMCGLSSMMVQTHLLKSGNVHITEKCFYADIEFVIYGIFLSNSFCYIDKPMYMYRNGHVNQSVSKKNMLKNIEMQKKVSSKICDLYQNEFGDADNEKKDFAFKRIVHTIGAMYRTFMLMGTAKITRDSIIEFDKNIKKKFPDVYKKMWENIFIFFVRVLNYSFVSVIRRLYRKKYNWNE